MSVAFRSCAARTLFNFSGWDDRDGGESRRLRGGEERPVVFVWTRAKSEVLSIVTAGAIAFAVFCWLEGMLIMSSMMSDCVG